MGATILFGKRTADWKSVTGLAAICLVAPFAFAGFAGELAPQSDHPTTLSSNSLPAKITTTDGKTFNGVKLLKVQLDGLVVEYHPDGGGTGLANLKFSKLPEPLQKQFGYDPAKASLFEREQARAAADLSQKLQQDEKIRTATLKKLYKPPALLAAVSVSSPDPTITYTYYAPGEKPDTLGENVATCRASYQCHVDFDFDSERSDTGLRIHFYITAVRFSLGMSCHIFEPKFSVDQIRLHEEGRRQIYEYFYRCAPQVARRVGESMMGKEFTETQTDFETAKQHALDAARRQAEAEYLLHVELVAKAADHYFEKLTDYAQNSVFANQAAEQAIAKYRDQINLQADPGRMLTRDSSGHVIWR